MIGLRVTTVDKTRDVVKAAAKASFENLGHAIASIRKAAIRSIRRSAKPAPAGKPPRTRRSRQLPRSIFYSVDRDKLSAITGPLASRVGTSAEAHEFGGRYMGEDYPARPFMGPALEQQADRMPAYWAGTVGR